MDKREKMILVKKVLTFGFNQVQISRYKNHHRTPRKITIHRCLTKSSALRLERIFNSVACRTNVMIFPDSVWLYGHYKGIPHDKNN